MAGWPHGSGVLEPGEGRGPGGADDRPLAELTTELTTMLGSPDPEMRDGLAYPTLATWIDRGVYDDLIAGLGDGMAAGLPSGWASRTPTRSSGAASRCWCWPSASTATTSRALVPPPSCSSGATGSRPGSCASATPGASCPEGLGAHRRARRRRLGVLARSPHFWIHELTVLLDVIGDRLLSPVDAVHARRARPARAATMACSAATSSRCGVVEPWVARLAGAAERPSTAGDPFLPTATPRRSSGRCTSSCLSPEAPEIRSDLLLVLGDALRAANPSYLTPTDR